MKRSNRLMAFAVMLSFLFLCVFANYSSAYAGGPVNKKLVAHYKFDGDFKDSSGNNNNGTAMGAIQFVDGVASKAAKFDNASYIDVNDSNSLDIDSGFTFSVWLNTFDKRPDENMPIFSKLAGNDEEYQPYSLSVDGLYPEVELIDEYTNYTTITSDTKVDIHKWNLLTATFDGTSVKIYVDGILKKNSTFKSPVPHSTGNIYIGSYIFGESYFYYGLMDDLKIYNYALSPTEVKALYDTVVTGTGKDIVIKSNKLVAHYKFDSDFKDSSGLNHNGTPISYRGGISFVEGPSGKAAKFDGANYIEVENSDWLQLNQAFTMSTWLYKDDNGGDGAYPVLSKLGSSITEEAPSYRLSDEDEYLYLSLFDEYTNESHVYPDKTLDMQKWHFISATYDGKSVKFYLDGVLTDNKELKSPMPHSSGKLFIGSDIENSTELLTGMLDDLRIYNYTLSPTEVKALYDSYGKAQAGGVMVLQLNNPIMKVNGVEKEIVPGTDTSPILYQTRTVVPIRAIIESMGGTIAWNGEERKVSLQLKSTTIELWIDSNTTTVNGVTKETDVAPAIINGSTMLPLRFVIENLGCTANWDGATQTITINYAP